MFEEKEYFNLIDTESELQVLYAGEQRCRPGHSHAGRRHHALWHLVLSGRGRVKTGAGTWEIGPGDSFLFLPDQMMSYQADRHDPWTYLWLGIGGRRVVHHLSRCGFSPTKVVSHGGPWAKAVGEQARAIFNLLRSEGDPREADSLAMQSALYSLLELLSRARQGEDRLPVRPAPYVSELISLMENAFSRPLTAEGLARYAGLERTYCARLFQRETGMGMKAYLTRLRMSKAQVLLSQTQMTVKAVAESVGYPNQEAFSKRFRRDVGVTPSGFREATTGEAGSAR